MATTVTKGATVLTVFVNGYESSQESGNLVHAIVGRGNPDITFGSAGLRTGTLKFVCDTQANALALVALHSSAGSQALADSDLAGLAMAYVWVDDMDVHLDDETQDFWVVEVGFQEVTP